LLSGVAAELQGLLRLNASAAAGEEQEDQHKVVQLTKGYLLAIGQAVEQTAAGQPAVEQQLWAYVVTSVKTPMSQQQFAAVCKKLVRKRAAAANGNVAGSSNVLAPAPLWISAAAAAAAAAQEGGPAMVGAAVTPGKTLPSDYGADASAFGGWEQQGSGDVQHAQDHHRQQQQQQASPLPQQGQDKGVDACHAAAHERSR
jgi:hypothetical protein